MRGWASVRGHTEQLCQMRNGLHPLTICGFATLWITLSILCKGKWKLSVMPCVLLFWCKVLTNWFCNQPEPSLVLAKYNQLLIVIYEPVLIISYTIHKPWILHLSLYLQLYRFALRSLCVHSLNLAVHCANFLIFPQ